MLNPAFTITPCLKYPETFFYLLFASIRSEEVIVSQTTEKDIKLAKATYLGPKDNKDKDGLIIVLLWYLQPCVDNNLF